MSKCIDRLREVNKKIRKYEDDIREYRKVLEAISSNDTYYREYRIKVGLPELFNLMEDHEDAYVKICQYILSTMTEGSKNE